MNRLSDTTRSLSARRLLLALWFALALLYPAQAFAKKGSEELKSLIEKINQRTEQDSAKFVAMIDRAMKMARAENNPDAIADCYFQHISYVVFENNMDYSRKKLDEFSRFVDETGVGGDKLYDAWLNVVISYYDFNKIVSMSLEIKRMLAHAQKHKSFYGIGTAYTAYGLVTDAHEGSMENLKKALLYMKKAGKDADCAYIYYTMANNSILNKFYDEAIEQADEMMKISSAKDFSNPAYYNQLASTIYLEAYTEKGNRKKARVHYNKLAKLWRESKIDNSNTFIVAEKMIKYLCAFGNPEAMWKYYNSIPDDMEDLRTEMMMRYYRGKKDYKRALEMQERYDSIVEHYRSLKEKEEFADANAQYNNHVLEQRNERLRREKAEKERQIEAGIIVILIALGLGSTGHILMLRKKNKQLAAERDRVEEARKKEEKLNKMKTTFISNISHEIRTPLNAIVGFNNLLNNHHMELTDEERREMFGAICDKSDQLLKLSEQVMALSHIDADELEAEITEQSLRDICDKAKEKITQKISPNVELLTDYQDPALTIKTDARLLTQIIADLLDNAAKFTSKGHILLAFAKRDDGTTEISVADTGIGIAKENAAIAFERFEKLGRMEQGFGLGLSICKDIIELLGGRIHIDTNYTGGTRFVVDMP